MDIYCQVTDMGLVPLYGSDYDEKKKLRVGDKVICSIKRARNYQFHKKFFALLRLTYDNLPEMVQEKLGIRSEHDLLDWLKIELGMFSTYKVNCSIVLKMDSISFSAMDEDEFEAFYKRCISVILNHYLLNVPEDVIREEIEQFL